MDDPQITTTDAGALMEEPESAAPRRRAAPFDMALIGIGILLLASRTPTIWGDGGIRYAALDGVLSHAIKPKMKYSFVGPFLSSPLYLMGKVFGHAAAFTARYNLLLFISMLAGMWLILRRWVGARVLASFTLLLIAGSMFSNHILSYYGELFTAVFAAVGVAFVIAGPALAGWLILVLGVVNTPATLVGLAVITFQQIVDQKRWRYVVAPVLAFVYIELESYVRNRQLFGSYYAGEHGIRTIMPYSGLGGFSYPLFFGILSIVLSFGKGLLFFAPGLFLPVRTRLKAIGEEVWQVYLLWLLFLLGLLLVYSRYWSWHGNVFWGPRYFVFASIPAALALAVALDRPYTDVVGRLLLLTALAMAVWVGVNGFVFGQLGQGTCPLYASEEALCLYTPEFSSLWLPFIRGKALTALDYLFIWYGAIVFLRVALPTMRSLGRDLRESLKRVRSVDREALSWRF